MMTENKISTPGSEPICKASGGGHSARFLLPMQRRAYAQIDSQTFPQPYPNGPVSPVIHLGSRRNPDFGNSFGHWRRIYAQGRSSATEECGGNEKKNSGGNNFQKDRRVSLSLRFSMTSPLTFRSQERYRCSKVDMMIQNPDQDRNAMIFVIHYRIIVRSGTVETGFMPSWRQHLLI